MQMDVRDMSFFPDESFGGVIDKGISYSFQYKPLSKLMEFIIIYLLHYSFTKATLVLLLHRHSCSAGPRSRNS